MWGCEALSSPLSPWQMREQRGEEGVGPEGPGSQRWCSFLLSLLEWGVCRDWKPIKWLGRVLGKNGFLSMHASILGTGFGLRLARAGVLSAS